MNRREHEVAVIVEETFYTGESTVRLYVLRVRKKSVWEGIKGKGIDFYQRAEPCIIRLSLAVLATVLLTMILIPEVTKIRGYIAFGGEYLCIALAFWGFYKLSKLITK